MFLALQPGRLCLCPALSHPPGPVRRVESPPPAPRPLMGGEEGRKEGRKLFFGPLCQVWGPSECDMLFPASSSTEKKQTNKKTDAVPSQRGGARSAGRCWGYLRARGTAGSGVAVSAELSD